MTLATGLQHGERSRLGILTKDIQMLDAFDWELEYADACSEAYEIRLLMVELEDEGYDQYEQGYNHKSAVKFLAAAELAKEYQEFLRKTAAILLAQNPRAFGAGH